MVTGAARVAETARGPIDDPVIALEEAVADALEQPPCLVSFSGGHDSSLVLAIAVSVARRRGLPLPVPITWRFPDVPATTESAMQEAVVAALGLSDWVILPARDELDLVGPGARRVLLRHGLQYPPNTFLHAPLLEQAAGGSLLTGVGGDQVLGGWPRTRRPWALRRPGSDRPFPWLWPPVARRVNRSLYLEGRAMPHAPAARIPWQARRRRVTMTCDSLAGLAGAAGARIYHPLLDPAFTRALANWVRMAGRHARRAQVVAEIFGGAVPRECVQPRHKAIFTEVFWSRHSRSLSASFDGTGVDRALVDPDGLRNEWRRVHPRFQTSLLLQQLWIEREGGRARSGLVGTP
jgi:Asparagine synthase